MRDTAQPKRIQRKPLRPPSKPALEAARIIQRTVVYGRRVNSDVLFDADDKREILRVARIIDRQFGGSE